MSKKSFSKLTKAELTTIVQEVTRSSSSKSEIRQRLVEAGFDEGLISVTAFNHGIGFCPVVVAFGPHSVKITSY